MQSCMLLQIHIGLLNWYNGVTIETTVHLAVESYATFEQTSLSVISLESSPMGTRLICDVLEKKTAALHVV